MLHWFARRLKEVQERDNEKGFTLIELLVVVIIIGILLGIAIPVYLDQRTTAQNNVAQANLRTAASAQQTRATQTGNYTASKSDLANYGFTDGTPTVTIVTPASGTTGATFCMSAPGAGTTTYYSTNTSPTPSTTVCT